MAESGLLTCSVQPKALLMSSSFDSGQITCVDPFTVNTGVTLF